MITSSPGPSRRSPSLGEVKRDSASRLADEPEFTSRQSRTPHQRANSRSNWSAKRPGGQPEIERGIHQRAHFRGVEDPAGDRAPWLAPGTNSRAGKALGAILAHQIENLRAESACGLSCQELPVPGDGALQALFESEERRPASSSCGRATRSGTGGGSRSTPRSGLRARVPSPSSRRMRFTRSEHRDFALVREVERLPVQFGTRVQAARPGACRPRRRPRRRNSRGQTGRRSESPGARRAAPSESCRARCGSSSDRRRRRNCRSG